jgi:hypothetical protein
MYGTFFHIIYYSDYCITYKMPLQTRSIIKRANEERTNKQQANQFIRRLTQHSLQDTIQIHTHIQL